MWRNSMRAFGWQGISLVAITYVYFLIFAQFAFLKRLAVLGIAGSQLECVMAAMAVGGILFSLLTPRLNLWTSPELRIRIGLSISGAAALLSLINLNFFANIAISFLIGAGLGVLTVTLVTHLRRWMSNRHPLLGVALGTGIAYLFCNVPFFFSASVKVQTAVAGLLCLGGIGVTFLPLLPQAKEPVAPTPTTLSFLRVLACFTALVWLDSAAFFIVQNSPQLKAGTWDGTVHLWSNGVLHLLAALASAWLLSRRRLSWVLPSAFFAIGVACLLLLDPDRIGLASLFYPIGVSLYSVALVAYPALLAPCTTPEERGRQAGWLYAIAGWSGSAMGIGMGQNLGSIPPLFVLIAGAVILLACLPRLILRHHRELTLTLSILLVACVINRVLTTRDTHARLTSIGRGRQVYISEGCINCHSQYVRPNSPDALMWGPVKPLEQLRRERPPLIGNRRQGPDLSAVGGRRSLLWLKIHFCNPHEVSGASIMPSYAFLFHDSRGDDLVSYLGSLNENGLQQHQIEEDNWRPTSFAVASANPKEGQLLFSRYCATCHDANGKTRRAASFKRLPPDLTVGPYVHLSRTNNPIQQREQLARITKFGIHGTDMPGHEYLPDHDIASISFWLSQQLKQPSHNQ
jgi:cytochrome c oxidase cbb3-type subunit 2